MSVCKVDVFFRELLTELLALEAVGSLVQNILKAYVGQDFLSWRTRKALKKLNRFCSFINLEPKKFEAARIF